ncbi:MAG: pyridoxine 5'-phosphate synthase [Desulfobacteraceae bacterium]|nr:MAG: pyridoxine 5'-phosphate synthase [Desulfobacteraceae bacterium]
MAGLTVLLDHVAILRDVMQSDAPEPVAAALLAESAGADGIGIYLREDHPPIRERDVRLLRQTIHSRLVLYMATTSQMVGLALDVKPERVVLMPAMRDDGSYDYRFDAVSDSKLIFESVDTLQSNGISVGVSIAPEPDQVKTVHQMRANWVHLHVERLRSATTAALQTTALGKIIDAVKMAHRLRMHIAVGHGLDYRLIKLFAGVREIDEFSIGRHLIARAVLVGMDRAVRDMAALIRSL